MINDIKEIEALTITGAGQSFNGDDFRSLRKAGVYTLMLGNDCLYVGMSRCLLNRLGMYAHHAREAIAECDKVLIFPCINLDAAHQLESILIFRLKPKYNKRNISKRLKMLLGMTNASHLNYGTAE